MRQGTNQRAGAARPPIDPPSTVGGALPARAGDPATRLAQLYDEMLPTVYGYCRSRQSREDAEDTTSEVFRCALEQLARVPSPVLTRSWFITTARNRIIDRWRHQARWARRLREVAPARAAAQDGPGEHAAGPVIRALDDLPRSQRAALVLHHVDDLPVDEVAAILGRSPVAVESLLARARRALAASVATSAGDGHR